MFTYDKRTRWPTATECFGDMNQQMLFSIHQNELNSLHAKLESMTVPEALETIAEFQVLNSNWFDVCLFIVMSIMSESVFESLDRKVTRPARQFAWVAFHVKGLPGGACYVYKDKVQYYKGKVTIQEKPEVVVFKDESNWLSMCRAIGELFLSETKTEAFKKVVSNAMSVMTVFEAVNDFHI